MASKNKDITVFITRRDSTCDECGHHLGNHAWITLNPQKGALCLACADLDHLVFLPSGNAALTRRSKKYSRLFAVVLEWSRTRKRYERQGLLVEEEAIAKAEQECLADADIREQRREREAVRRAELDQHYLEKFAAKIRELYPNCPKNREQIIARHACLKYSGRVGRSAAAKNLDEEAIRLAMIAHIRHAETRYDELLISGWERLEARREVDGDVQDVLSRWLP